MKNLIDFKGLIIRLASPETVKSWSKGEVTKPETINYRTLKPEKDGLFCEKIFGPTKDYECYCGKYKHIRYRGIICDKCGVEVTHSRVRRERMGHISLATPVAHVWFFKRSPSKLSLLLGVSPRSLAGVIYFAKYLVLNIDKKAKKETLKKLEIDLKDKQKSLEKEFEVKIESLEADVKKEISDIKKRIRNKEQQDLATKEARVRLKQQILTIQDNLASEQETAEQVFKAVIDMVKKVQRKTVIGEEEYLKLIDYNAADFLKVGMGAEAVLDLIQTFELDQLTTDLRKKIKNSKGAKKIKLLKRLRMVESMNQAEIQPRWMILKTLPVIPPDLRPMVQLSGGRFATSDLNDLYRRVINRNNRLKHLINLGAPEIILRNEKRMLQESVDALIDSTQAYKVQRRSRRKELRSLTDMLSGKQGRFRRNLLGKRVDYSGRSVIVVGPELDLNECGLPKEMALEMFKPFVLRELITRGIAPNVKNAKNVLETCPPEVFDILEEITVDHPVLLNRAPTLHKLGIQAFYPVLTEGKAIKLHPCVCSGYNADFDGDQMAVHVPLSKRAMKESIEKMMPENNLLKPSNGSPITIPNKEMALGVYYVTVLDPRLELYPTIFTNEEEAIHAYQQKLIDLRQPVKVRLELLSNNKKIVKTSVGRILLNQLLPENLRFINQPVDNNQIKRLITSALDTQDKKEVAELIDNLKEFGFKGATISGISVGVFDCQMINNKDKLISKANKKAADIEANYKEGLITDEERKRLSNQLWLSTTEEIANKTWNNFEAANAVKVIIDSGGTRASKDQVKQLAAMRGLVVDPLGKIVEMPTKSNFREGLSIFEYVTSARGSRKGLTDSAIKTADAGYLTRRLVDVAHDMIIREKNCGTKKGLTINLKDNQEDFVSQITGRVLADDVIAPRARKPMFKRGELIDEAKAEQIIKAQIEKVVVRSPLTCESQIGLCAACYGWDLSHKKMVELGTPAGVLAAQSIGEPGTQLTMRVKHSGGIVTTDVTQGLPRVEELFEARTPKMVSPMSEIAGKVHIKETDRGYKVTVKTVRVKPAEEKTYTIPLTSKLNVEEKQLIPVGYQLAEGALDIKKLLKVRGLQETQAYLLREIQKVYESQGIPINDKHFEVIIRKMSDKVKIESAGDTGLMPGQIVERSRFEEENAQALAEGGDPAVAQVTILGITRSALYTESWLSAASFIETSRVLTDAASGAKEDRLLGLKENVIIGRLIPTSPERAQIED